ncbi:MAG: ribosome small subunit-dependent GTPase A [Ruminococcaceae bacterium]|nr:ribosome small subunit-dependent GTPase A [Oscillospiraceae bacterium]
MEYRTHGKIIKGVGGLYIVRLLPGEDPLAGTLAPSRARGVFRHNHITPVVGDEVEVVYTEASFDMVDGKAVPKEDGRNIMISGILPRRNSLIRPPVANIDVMFVSMAAASPAPIPETIDKMLSILEHSGIEPVVVVEKCELDRERAEELRQVYTLAGYRVFVLSCVTGEGVEEIKKFVHEELRGKTAAFAGASGVGKSTLMNALFPNLRLDTSDISRKIERGRHTTRHVELFPISENIEDGCIADTPGFSMLDFERFDFFTKDELPMTMREFEPYIGLCRYTKCTHTKDEGCAVLEAVREGKIARSRHESFVAMYNVLKEKKSWEKN